MGRFTRVRISRRNFESMTSKNVDCANRYVAAQSMGTSATDFCFLAQFFFGACCEVDTLSQEHDPIIVGERCAAPRWNVRAI